MDTFLRQEAAGLYDPAYEHDNCGVGAVADLAGEPRHETLIRALDVLDRLEHQVEAFDQKLLGWRDVPVDLDVPGKTAAEVQPVIRQVLIGSTLDDQDAFERKLYVIRRTIERERGSDLAIPSFSSRTIVYKGMLLSPQLRRYYPDLCDKRMKSQLALVHSRFSTNTFPSWQLAHPYRMIAHNGEINTL